MEFPSRNDSLDIGLASVSLLPLQGLPGLNIDDATLQSEKGAMPGIAALTTGMVQSEEAAYRQFYALYFDRLLRYLLVLTRDEEAAREALQLTLVRVVKHARRFESDEHLWSWLTVLARSSVVDEQRKKKRYSFFLTRFFQEAQTEETESAANVDGALMEALDEQLSALDPEERELLRRKYLEGESVREIAEASLTSEKAIESKLVRVRRKLKQMIFSHLKHEP